MRASPPAPEKLLAGVALERGVRVLLGLGRVAVEELEDAARLLALLRLLLEPVEQALVVAGA
jgi:hypothetical protein